MDRVVAELAGRQHGVVAYWQLIDLGLTIDAIEWRIRAGRLHRMHVGVYAVGHLVLGIAGHRMAAVLACGPDAVLSHRDGGAHWRIFRTSRAHIDVTAPRGRKHLHEGITVHRPRLLLPDEHTVHDGIPVTTVARTLVDLAAVVSLNSLRYAWDRAEAEKLFDLTEIQTVRQRFKRRKGIRNIDILIDERRPLPQITRSDLEILFVEFCAKYGLPTPSMNSWVGSYEVDAVFPEHRLAIELDSRYHDTPGAYERDPIRDADLQIMRYRILRITYRRLLTQPDELAGQIRRLLAA